MKGKALFVPVGALLLATASAHAADVTIYGRINTSLESQKLSGQDAKLGLQSNGSRWGLRGTEDLGGGLKAIFKLESGFESDTGAFVRGTGIFNRETFLGLEGRLGTLRLGRINSVVYLATADYVSRFNDDTGSSADGLFGFAATGNNSNNSVAYSTPSLAGGKLDLSHSFSTVAPEQAGASNNQRNYQVAYQVARGPLQIAAGYAQMNAPDLAGIAGPTNRNAVLRAWYTVGSFAVGGYYERAKLFVKDAAAGDAERSRNNFRIAGLYRRGASEFHLNYGIAGDFGGLDDSGAQQWTLAYIYKLSKRTQAYTFFTRLAEDSNTSYYNGSRYGLAAAPKGSTFSSFALGLRHQF